MKKALSILAVAMLVPLLSSPAWAEGDEAYSANAIGVVKYIIPAGGELVCVSLPLAPLDDPRNDGSWTWGSTTLAQQLDVGSTVYFWKDSAWLPYTKVSPNPVYTNGWVPTADAWVLPRGEAFFIRGVKTAQADKTISLLGELPTEENLTYALTGSKNLDTKGATVYPVAMQFGDTSVAEQLDVGDAVYFWTNNTWMPYTKVAPNPIYANGWVPTADTWQLGVGEGIFIKHAGAATTITDNRPFEW